MNIDLRSLIGKLTPTARRTFAEASSICLSNTHFDVELEHWILAMLGVENGDLRKIFRHFEIEPNRIENRLRSSLETFKNGNNRTPAVSQDVAEAIQQGWLWSSVNKSLDKVRTGAVLLGALQDSSIRQRLMGSAAEFAMVDTKRLDQDLLSIVGGSEEDKELDHGRASGSRTDTDTRDSVAPRSTAALDRFTHNLTAAAREGRIDPVLGREPEVRQIVDILMRRRQNNPILTGEAGVGKTAVVEGFANRITRGDVPEPLRGVEVHTLDLGLLQAGAGVKGEFENRLRQVIEEVRAATKPIILFIDEAHTLIGAGGQEGQNDAANLLKPALARGELRTIAATTWAEYKKYFEKDAALTRRFQVVKVEEPDESVGIQIMRGLRPVLEKHHGVRIRDEAVVESVRLSMRYLPARQLPDKSVSVLDTACARVAIQRASTPAVIEDRMALIESIQTEICSIEEEIRLGANESERLGELTERLRIERSALERDQARWKREQDVVSEIDSRLEDSAQARASLVELQGEQPLVHAEVTGQTVAEVVAAWTGIPLGRMVRDEIRSVLTLADRLRERVRGQDHALDTIAERIRASKAGVDNPGRPVGVFMLAGPSGVGKTETALALAEALFGGERSLVTINMSEYQEAHTVSSLKGAPPGYVGYGEGGVLTEAVRRRPYAVVLLDEVEKAHRDVMELFFQVFDKGVLEDGEGRMIDFKNTVILLTTNAGSDEMMRLCDDPETAPDPGPLAKSIRPYLLEHFPAALLGRLAVIPYYPIRPEILSEIAHLQLSRIVGRIRDNHGIEVHFENAFVEWAVARCNEPESGARNVDRILTQELLPTIATELLALMSEGRQVDRLSIGLADGEIQLTRA